MSDQNALTGDTLLEAVRTLTMYAAIDPDDAERRMSAIDADPDELSTVVATVLAEVRARGGDPAWLSED